MEKGRIEFSITSLEQGGNSEPNGNVQLFFYILIKLRIFQDNLKKKIPQPNWESWIGF